MSTGALVVVRGRRAHVDAVVPHEDCAELRVTFEPRRQQALLWPFDRPAAMFRPPRLRAVRARAWIRSMRALLSSDVDPLVPRAAPRDADIVPYQLAPALAVAAGSRRVLLADEVGLGKTIQAGWIAADLVARDAAARVLIAVPASVRHQWTSELSQRFGLDAIEADAKWLRAAIADLPPDVSPWTPPGVYIASIDFLKRGDVLRSAMPLVWDAMIVDEAHTAAAPTDRHAAVASLARRARRLVLITATPYSGDAPAFASMIALGEADAPAAPPAMFRRFRDEVGDVRRRRHRFVAVRLTRAETRFQRLLERYSRTVWHAGEPEAANARLAMTILRKRALSSPAAAARSLRRRRELLAARAQAPLQLALFDADDEIDDDVPAAALAAPGLADAHAERRWLDALIEAAEAAVGRDSKLAFLERLLRRLPGESIVIFTEYRDTLAYLASRLPPAVLLQGGMSARERSQAQRSFNAAGGLLLATDAAAEGLNLQGRCRLVLNYELPWNPARLEQRIGRVDRIGQDRTVHAITMTARDTAEDLVIGNLMRRLCRIAATLGRADCLTAFLDDARMASVVIGGGSPGDLAGAQESITLTRVHGDREQEEETARMLADGGARRTVPDDILVAALAGRGRIAGGFVVVFSSTAHTADGALVARRCDAVHVAAPVEKPSRRAALRAQVEKVLQALPPILSIVPAIAPWLTRVRAVHQRSIEAFLERERALRDWRDDRAAIQPGLFDRRALDAADDGRRVDAALAAEHTQRIEALGRARELQLATRPIGVLLVWR